MAKDKLVPLGIGLLGGNAKVYNTIAEMQKDSKLKTGKVVEVLGYYQAGDGAGHKRVIADSDDGSGVQLENGLYANIVHNGIVHSNWFGANKSGNVNDIFKKIVAYNKPTIIDYGNYELSEFIFDIEGIVQEDRGTYTNKYLIKTDKLPNDKPHKEMIGIFNYQGIMTQRGHQSVAYNKNTQEYILGFANTSNEQSTLIFLDKNFKYIKKSNLDLGHCNGLTYNPRTNKLIAGGYLDDTEKNNTLYVIDYNTLNIEKQIVLEHYISGVSYDEQKDLYMAGGSPKYSLLDKEYNVVKTIGNNGSIGEGLVTQDNEFFKGYFWAFSSNSPIIAKTQMTAFNLKGKIEKQYVFESTNNDDEPEGIFSLDDNTLLVTEYHRTEIKFYKIDFSKISLNSNDVNTSQEIKIYIDSSVEFEGDGSQQKPFKTIRYALLKHINSRFLDIYLKGTFDENITLNGKDSVRLLKTNNEEDVIIKGQLVSKSVGQLNIYNLKFMPTKQIDRIIFLESTNGYFNGTEISQPTPSTSHRGIAIYRSFLHIFGGTKINNCSYVLSCGESSSANITNCSGDGNTKRFTVSGGVIFQINNNFNTSIDVIVGGLGEIYPQTPSTAQLDTPIYKTLMEQEGVYTDYANYSLAQLKYEKEQRANEKAKYEAYELLLQDNPELTWEEIEQTYGNTSMMNLSLVERLEEPTIPESVVKFMEKYLGTTPKVETKSTPRTFSFDEVDKLNDTLKKL